MPHISYSELKIWAECPYKHKLIYINKVRKFIGNEFTAFGKAIHNLCENAMIGSLAEYDFDAPSNNSSNGFVNTNEPSEGTTGYIVDLYTTTSSIIYSESLFASFN